MRITSKGQVTIPQDVRERAGLMPGTDVEFRVEANGAVRLVKSAKPSAKRTRGQSLVERLRGKGKFGMSTDEVIALVRGPSADDELRRKRR